MWRRRRGWCGCGTRGSNLYTIGGAITGLTASGLVLQNNLGNDLSVSSGATSFTFSTALANSAAYSVTISSNTTGLTCSLSNSSGTVASANVTSVLVTCHANSVTIGGTITNLSTSVGLHISSGQTLSGQVNGPYSFTPIAYGTPYTVTIPAQPAGQRCTVSNATGTATADVSNVNVDCVTAYTISATVSGLGASIGLVLQDKWQTSNSDILSATSETTFNFSQQLIQNETYSVRALIQPVAPAKTCAITGGASGTGSGTVAASGVNVTVTCAPPVPRFAYVANFNSDNVSAFEIAASGVLVSAASSVPAGAGPFFVTVDPTGQFAYVANANSWDISAYTINAASGTLTQVNCVANATTTCDPVSGFTNNYLAGSNTHAITVDPTGQFLYVENAVSGDISAFTIDVTTGALTQIDCGGGTACDIANSLPKNFLSGIQTSSVTVDHTGKFLYATNADEESVSAYTINTTTGALTRIPCGGSYVCDTLGNHVNFLVGSGAQSLDIDPTSRFVYVANVNDNSVSALKIESDGSLSQILCGLNNSTAGCDTITGANFLAGTGPVSLAVGPLGNYVYVANSSSNDVTSYSIDNIGKLTVVGTYPVTGGGILPPTPTSVAVDLLNQYVYVSNYNAGVSAFSTVAGVLTQINCGGGATTCETVNSSGWDFLAGSNPRSIVTAVQH